MPTRRIDEVVGGQQLEWVNLEQDWMEKKLPRIIIIKLLLTLLIL